MTAAAAGHLGGHQEEGIGRALQERRPTVAAEGPARNVCNVHDFLDPEKGKAIPYGVYDLGRNVGWVSVGIDHDTARFAVATIRRWWRELGRKAYPSADTLLDHRRQRRQQRLAAALVEVGTAALRRRQRPDDLRLPPAAGHQQVEQDRAPSVLLHLAELARPTPADAMRPSSA